jgi:mannose-6-phosphate isomerase
VSAPDFHLCRVRLDGHESHTSLAPNGPRTVFCLSGNVTVTDSACAAALQGGQAAFGAADAGSLRLYGNGDVFIAAL